MCLLRCCTSRTGSDITMELIHVKGVYLCKCMEYVILVHPVTCKWSHCYCSEAFHSSCDVCLQFCSLPLGLNEMAVVQQYSVLCDTQFIAVVQQYSVLHDTQFIAVVQQYSVLCDTQFIAVVQQYSVLYDTQFIEFSGTKGAFTRVPRVDQHSRINEIELNG